MITDNDIFEYRLAMRIESKIDMEEKEGPCIEYAIESVTEPNEEKEKLRSSLMGFNAERVNQAKQKIEEYLKGITDPVLREAMKLSIKDGIEPKTAAKMATGKYQPQRVNDRDFIRYYEVAVSNRMNTIQCHRSGRA